MWITQLEMTHSFILKMEQEFEFRNETKMTHNTQRGGAYCKNIFFANRAVYRTMFQKKIQLNLFYFKRECLVKCIIVSL